MFCKCTSPELSSVDNKVELVASQTVKSLKTVLGKEGNVLHKNMVACELVRRATI